MRFSIKPRRITDQVKDLLVKQAKELHNELVKRKSNEPVKGKKYRKQYIKNKK